MNVGDGRIFWYSQYLALITWILLGIVNIFSFNLSWLMLVSVALTLTYANIYGYTQCDKDFKAKVSNEANNMFGIAMNTSIGKSVASSVMSSMFSSSSK